MSPALIALALAAAAEWTVSGRVLQHARVCGGGAAVTQEDYDKLPPPAPIAGMTIAVQPGATIGHGPARSFVTTGDGKYTMRLPAGTWCFFAASRALPPAPKPRPGDGPPPVVGETSDGIDMKCLEYERVRCDLVIEVKGEMKGVDIGFYDRCSEPWSQPCYRGPMPP